MGEISEQRKFREKMFLLIFCSKWGVDKEETSCQKDYVGKNENTGKFLIMK